MKQMFSWQFKAIAELNSKAEYSSTIVDGVITEIDWAEGTSPISLEEINTKANELKDLYEYKDLRKAEYPPIKDQLDDIFHNGIDGWKETIQAVKDKYPKE